VPLLPRKSADPLGNRDETRDAAFWGDPRLARAAVHYLTPKLVLLDPDHQELYLDNEIALLEKLRGLEQEITQELTPVHGLPSDLLASMDPYFGHRFLRGAFAVAGVRTASSSSSLRCAALPTDSLPTRGPELYFETLRQLGASVKACALQTPIRQAATSGEADGAQI
jgi:ABC-type Zn uptake system ZnuABC Zn-binding protein ZnuA